MKKFLKLTVSGDEINSLLSHFQEKGVLRDIEIEKLKEIFSDCEHIRRGKKDDVIFIKSDRRIIGKVRSPMDAYKRDLSKVNNLVSEIQESPNAKKIIKVGKIIHRIKRYLTPYEFKVRVIDV